MKAQSNNGPFRAYLYNNEFDVYLRINFYDQNVRVPGQDLFGEVPGFLSKKNYTFAWLITSVTIKGNKAHLALSTIMAAKTLQLLSPARTILSMYSSKKMAAA